MAYLEVRSASGWRYSRSVCAACWRALWQRPPVGKLKEGSFCGLFLPWLTAGRGMEADWRQIDEAHRPATVLKIKEKLEPLVASNASKGADAARENILNHIATQFETIHWRDAPTRHDYTERITKKLKDLEAQAPLALLALLPALKDQMPAPAVGGHSMEPSTGAKHASLGSHEPAAKRMSHGKLPMAAQQVPPLTRGHSEVNDRPEHAYVPGPVQRCAGDESCYDWGTLTVKPLPPPRDADVEKCAGCRYAFAPEAQLRECPRCSRRFHEGECWVRPGPDPDPAGPDVSGFCRVCLPPGASAEEVVLVWVADQFEKAGLSIVLIEKISNAATAARFTEQSGTGGGANMQRLFHLSGAGFGHLCEKGLEMPEKAGHFGRGLYFSVQPGKCDNYWRKAMRGDGGAVVAAHTGKDPKTTRAMYCTKVLLGRPFEHAQGQFDKSLNAPPRGFDSVAGNCNGEPESVVYDAARTELEYLIHYEVSSEIADLEAQGYDARLARAQGPAAAMLHAGGASTLTTSTPRIITTLTNIKFTAVPRANLDLAKEIEWKVLSSGEWEAGALDPVMFVELGKDGEEVVRLPCHSKAISCTMNRSTAETAFRNSNNCPCCQQLYPSLPGPQPSGVMKAQVDPHADCEGHAAGRGSIAVRYEFEGGVQLEQHPEPGKIYKGRLTNVFLPNDDAGSKALQLLKLAFERGLLFRVGKSVTTGNPEDGIVWNGIHQKTRRDGGAANHGYPDPTFLQRLQSECELQGVRLPDGAGGGDRATTADARGAGAASSSGGKVRHPPRWSDPLLVAPGGAAASGTTSYSASGKHEALERCKYILTQLMQHPWAGPFLKPVDPLEHDWRGHLYYDVIKDAIDLGTIKKRLEANQYADIEEFESEVKRVWGNYYKFYTETKDDSVRRQRRLLVQKLELFFGDKMQVMRKLIKMQ